MAAGRRLTRDERLDADPDVQRTAANLGVRGERGLARAIVSAVVDRLGEGMTRDGLVVESLEDLRDVVLQETGLHVVRVTDDAELRAAEREWAKQLKLLPRQLSAELARDTEALVVSCEATGGHSHFRHVAFVDARGARAARSWFGERHEWAHLLAPESTTSPLARRTTADRSAPLEQLIDGVASAVGFWKPVVKPVLDTNVAQCSDFLEAFELTRNVLAPEASREACFRAFAELVDSPLVVIRSDYRGRRRAASEQLGSEALRAATVITNDAATERGLRVWQNYRIPPDSVIAAAHASAFVAIHGDDDLGRWPAETGRRLQPLAVRIIAKGPWAIIRPAS